MLGAMRRWEEPQSESLVKGGAEKGGREKRERPGMKAIPILAMGREGRVCTWMALTILRGRDKVGMSGL